MKIVVWVHIAHYRDAVLRTIAATPNVELVVVNDAAELRAAIAGADGVISNGASIYTPEFEQLIRNTPSIRWFQSVSAGNDNMERLGIRDGITVTGSEGHSGPIVAEHAVALLLAIAHAMPDCERAKSARVWKMPRTGTFRSLYRATVSIIGVGHIGSDIARRLRGFDMTILGVSRSGKGGEYFDEGIRTTALLEALGRSDAVIVAAPLTAETEKMINAEAIAAMRPGAYLVNIARGGLVDQEALIAALESGHLGGAAIDVTTPEPLPTEDPLWAAPNCIISPHVGGSGSPESVKRLGQTVKVNLDAFIAGQPFRAPLPYGRP